MKRKLVDALLRAGLRLVPPGRVLAVHGWRDDEENSLRTAAAAVRRAVDGARVVLLCEDPERARRLYRVAAQTLPEKAREPEFVRKNSASGVWAFLRSSAVFNTHGIFGNPPSRGRRLYVLLGHGHGPKSATPRQVRFDRVADLATTNTDTWGRAVIRDQGILDPAAVLTTGNPREDAFDEPRDRSRLAALGIDPGSPFIAWLPTYRTTGEWIDGAGIETYPRYQEAVDQLAEACQRHGVTLVTKAHMLDASASHTTGRLTVTTEALLEAGLSFYQFLALSDGLISDFSSVWVDYLSAGRSIGLLIRDLEEYSVARGLNSPALSEVAAGLLLDSADSINEFVRAVAAGEVWQSAELKQVAEKLGFHSGPSRTDAVLDAVHSSALRCGVPLPLRRETGRSVSS